MKAGLPIADQSAGDSRRAVITLDVAEPTPVEILRIRRWADGQSRFHIQSVTLQPGRVSIGARTDVSVRHSPRGTT